MIKDRSMNDWHMEFSQCKCNSSSQI